MSNLKRTLKNAGIWCLVATVLNISSLLANIFLLDSSAFDIVIDSICTGLSVLTGILYIYLSKKPQDYILKKKSIIFTLSILNIFNIIIVWILSVWVQFALNKEVRNEQMKQMFKNQNSNNSNSENIVDIDKTEYEIKQSTETLTSALEELQNLKDKNLISEEEYEKLRIEAIKKFMGQSN